MRFLLGCELDYDIATETTMLLNIEAQRTPQQEIVRESFIISPDCSTEPHTVSETGNRYRRLRLAPGRVNIRYEAEVITTPQVSNPADVRVLAISELPFDVLNHLYPSRYCQSDKLGRFAWRQFGEIADGHERVTAICNWIFEHVDYLEGSSDASTSAYDTFTLRAGVCRDFAHLGITFARALGIPARFVSAYALDLVPQDFHAVFEAYLDGRWYLFDATRLCPIDGIVRIAVGRDAADSAFATYFGQVTSPPKSLWVNRIDGAPVQEWTVDAISLGAA